MIRRAQEFKHGCTFHSRLFKLAHRFSRWTSSHFPSQWRGGCSSNFIARNVNLENGIIVVNKMSEWQTIERDQWRWWHLASLSFHDPLLSFSAIAFGRRFVSIITYGKSFADITMWFTVLASEFLSDQSLPLCYSSEPLGPGLPEFRPDDYEKNASCWTTSKLKKRESKSGKSRAGQRWIPHARPEHRTLYQLRTPYNFLGGKPAPKAGTGTRHMQCWHEARFFSPISS